MPQATYRQVCGGGTGHAEAVRVAYDPERVDYERLLAIFWANHDPTQVDGQGVNRGDQYRSAIFFHSPEQEAAALASREELEESGRFARPIATAVQPAPEWIRAEEYHQQYYEKQVAARRR